MPRARPVPSVLVAAAALAAAANGYAQTACKTPNCVVGASPVVCQNRAAPRTPTVLMTSSGVNFVYVPNDPKIEPGDCVTWKAATATHSSSEDGCINGGIVDTACGSPAPAGCLWDSGNVASLATSPFAVCAYDPVLFPATDVDSYYCRIHATPTSGTMHGTLQVTTPIVLSVNKSGANVVLTWTGGGVAADQTFKVAKSTEDKTFAAANTSTVNPDGGVAGRMFTDTNEVSLAPNRYYLVRNKQSNE